MNNIPKDAHAIIIGAMKCGTTSLYAYLEEHPEICGGTIKEPEYFSEHQSHGVKVNDYSDLFDFDSDQHRYTLDGSTGYTKYPMESLVAQRMAEYGISPKFIYILRNPFDRIESHINFMEKYEGWSFEKSGDQIFSTSNYYLQLEQYRKHFSPDQFLLLDFDDLKRDPRAVYEQTCRFLGLTEGHYPKTFQAQNQTSASPGLARIARAYNLHKLPIPFSTPLKRMVNALLKKTSLAKKRKLSQEQRDAIFHELKVGMQQLHSVYGFNTEKWGFAPSGRE